MAVMVGIVASVLFGVSIPSQTQRITASGCLSNTHAPDLASYSPPIGNECATTSSWQRVMRFRHATPPTVDFYG